MGANVAPACVEMQSNHFFAVASLTGSGILRSTKCSTLSDWAGGALAERAGRVLTGREEKRGEVGRELASTISASEPSSARELAASENFGTFRSLSQALLLFEISCWTNALSSARNSLASWKRTRSSLKQRSRLSALS